MYNIKPLNENIETLQTSIVNEEELINQSSSATDSGSEDIVKKSAELQKRLPVSSLVDQFLLHLESAEAASGSLIRSISFSENDGSKSGTEGETGDNPASKSSSMENTRTLSDSTKTGAIYDNTEAITDAKLPPGIKKVTATMVVEASDYFQLEAFIKAVEELPRITKVESIAFSGNRELRQVSEPPDNLLYNMTVSTFYYPRLDDLKKQLPKYDVPEPSKKLNPFYHSEASIPSLEDQQDNAAVNSKEESRIVEKNNKKYKVYIYEVIPGDTLFKLSVEYYNNRKGETLIKTWNNLDSLQSGMQIEIPVPVDGKF
ncbi:LysM peptidoglycan-binding domain-containing protein [Bacillus sp. V5-8f]|uniref:LysM peptidoglycan-binding domain-containing protein n=1 Tax=Bacillus sp. V5-8f TaxID=2053044 RepID=UPI0015E0D5B2|nr:LysM peptidoglycan-binding domain-containing protein [Bacillus sp. V5-8f]